MELLQAVVLLGVLLHRIDCQHGFADWMGQHSDDTKLSEMNIPGTHDTMAFYGGIPAVCQTKPLTEQYDMGARFIDIRARRREDTLPIHHGPVFQKAYFEEDVVAPTVEWLKRHPGETILMLVMMESFKPVVGTLEYHQLVRNALTGAGARYLEHMPTTLGEARGYIIIVRKNWPSNEPIFGMHISYFDVYDKWTIDDPVEKWDGVRTNLDRVLSASKDELLVTYASGYTTRVEIPNPKAMAEYVNPRLAQYGKAHRHERMGIILVDFIEMEGNMATHILQ